MLAGDNIELRNGLRLSIDWLSWTLSGPCTLEDAFSMMGYSRQDFQVLPAGRNGYKSQMRHGAYPVSVQYDGNEGMGIHVDVSGSAVSHVLAHFHASRLCDTLFGTPAYETASLDFTVLCDFLSTVRASGHVTRIDIAIDDIGTNFYSLKDLYDVCLSGSYVSRFRNWKDFSSYSGGAVSGRTIYLGSRTSDIMLRVYDKQLEKNAKLAVSGQPPILHTWVRWELEIKKERAQQFVSRLLSGISLADASVGVLSNYLRIVEPDNPRKDRCKVSPVWARFVDGVAALPLYCPPPEKTLDCTREWLTRQVAPSLAAVVIADGGATDFVDGMLADGSFRLKKHHRELIAREEMSV